MIDIKSNQIITIPSAISKTGRHLASLQNKLLPNNKLSTHENEEETIRNVEVTQEARRQELLREENDEIFGVLPVVTADDEDE